MATLTGLEPVISRLEGGSLIQFGHRASRSWDVFAASERSEKRLAEGVGFEPTDRLPTAGRFQGDCVKPLRQPSASRLLRRVFIR